jgi:hypothetical protein
MYAVPCLLASVSTSVKTAGRLSVPGSAGKRVKVYEWAFGFNAAPNDNTVILSLERHTAVPTDTSVTPRPLDPADAACVSLAGQNATVEGTVTANSDLWKLPFNQRATYRWGTRDGSELIVPAVAANGLSARAQGLSGGYSGEVDGNLYFRE